MLVVNTVAIYSFHFAALWHVRMQISGEKIIQFLTQQYMFANVFVSLGGLRSAPMQCQKRKFVLRAQSFGCGICTAPQPWSMMMPITWQCGGRPCHQHGRQIKFKRMANGTQNRQGVGRLPASVRSWLLGCNHLQSMVPALRDLQPYIFTREGGGGQVF